MRVVGSISPAVQVVMVEILVADSVSDSESMGCEAGDTDTELEPEPYTWSLSDHVDFLTEMKVYILPVTREEMSGMIQTRVGREMELWKGRVRVGTV